MRIYKCGFLRGWTSSVLSELRFVRWWWCGFRGRNPNNLTYSKSIKPSYQSLLERSFHFAISYLPYHNNFFLLSRSVLTLECDHRRKGTTGRENMGRPILLCRLVGRRLILQCLEGCIHFLFFHLELLLSYSSICRDRQ